MALFNVIIYGATFHGIVGEKYKLFDLSHDKQTLQGQIGLVFMTACDAYISSSFAQIL